MHLLTNYAIFWRTFSLAFSLSLTHTLFGFRMFCQLKTDNVWCLFSYNQFSKRNGYGKCNAKLNKYFRNSLELKRCSKNCNRNCLRVFEIKAKIEGERMKERDFMFACESRTVSIVVDSVEWDLMDGGREEVLGWITNKKTFNSGNTKLYIHSNISHKYHSYAKWEEKLPVHCYYSNHMYGCQLKIAWFIL